MFCDILVKSWVFFCRYKCVVDRRLRIILKNSCGNIWKMLIKVGLLQPQTTRAGAKVQIKF